MKKMIICYLCLLLFSCQNKYVRTDKVCDNHFYIEIYEKWSQIGVSYLTDSINFKVYIGQLNFGLEEYTYECKKDSLIIIKYSIDYIKGGKKIIEKKGFNLNELIKKTS